MLSLGPRVKVILLIGFYSLFTDMVHWQTALPKLTGLKFLECDVLSMPAIS
jgi:hypothetical protein